MANAVFSATDVAIPANSEAVRLGAKRIRDVKTTINTVLSALFADGALKDGSITLAQLVDGILALSAVGHAKMADGYLSADAGVTSGSLTSGRVYRIDNLVSGDDFANVGYTAPGVEFTASGTTPDVWTNGTRVFDVVLEEGQAKMQDGFLTANAAGRAKMEDGYITGAKIAAGTITPDKLSDTGITPIDITSSARWSGSGYKQVIVTKTLPTGAFTAKTRLTVTTHGLSPMNNTNFGTNGLDTFYIEEEDNVPMAIITRENAASVADNGITTWTPYYVKVWDANTISLHTSVTGGIDGTTDIVTFTGNFAGSGNYSLKFLGGTSTFQKRCGVTPYPTTINANNVAGYQVVWRDEWDSATAGVAQFASGLLDLPLAQTPSATGTILNYFELDTGSYTPTTIPKATLVTYTQPHSIIGIKF